MSKSFSSGGAQEPSDRDVDVLQAQRTQLLIDSQQLLCEIETLTRQIQAKADELSRRTKQTTTEKLAKEPRAD
jgi:hypothetical protein